MDYYAHIWLPNSPAIPLLVYMAPLVILKLFVSALRVIFGF